MVKPMERVKFFPSDRPRKKNKYCREVKEKPHNMS
jgi:hypothetical protein